MIVSERRSDLKSPYWSLGQALSTAAVIIGLQLLDANDVEPTTYTVTSQDIEGQTNALHIEFNLAGREGSVEYFCDKNGQGHYPANRMHIQEGLAFDAQRFVDVLGNAACYNGVSSANGEELLIPISSALLAGPTAPAGSDAN